MKVESKNQEVNPEMRVSDKRGIQSQSCKARGSPTKNGPLWRQQTNKPGQNRGILKASQGTT